MSEVQEKILCGRPIPISRKKPEAPSRDAGWKAPLKSTIRDYLFKAAVVTVMTAGFMLMAFR